MIAAAIFVGIKKVRGALFPILIGSSGIFMLYIGIKALLDKSPRLKLAKQGLWTAKLGFVDWNDITKAQVVVNKRGRSQQTVLEIFLKGTVFAEANKPDERLVITAIDNKEFIETVIDNMIFKRKELTT